MSVQLAIAQPRRIKASRRRRRKIAAGRFVQRYYDPAIGRFLSVDPVATSTSHEFNFNRYWYANDNPYRFTDPDGRKIAPMDARTQALVANGSPRTAQALAQLEASENPWEIQFRDPRHDDEQSQVFPINENDQFKRNGIPGKGTGGVVFVSTADEKVDIDTGRKRGPTPTVVSPDEKFEHELVHGVQIDRGEMSLKFENRENAAIQTENQYREEQGLEGKRPLHREVSEDSK